MSKFLLTAVLALTSTHLSAEALKSKALRADICHAIENYIEDQDVPLTYEPEFSSETIYLAKDFIKNCTKAKASFQVTHSEFNPRAQTTTKLDVKVDLLLEKEIQITGKYKLSRTAFNPNTGEVELGPWQVGRVFTEFTLLESSRAVCRSGLRLDLPFASRRKHRPI